MWHNIMTNPKDLPTETKDYLVLHKDGSMALRRFTTNGFYFWSDKEIIAWTEHFQISSMPCTTCNKANWQNRFEYMCWTCGAPFCTASDADAPIY